MELVRVPDSDVEPSNGHVEITVEDCVSIWTTGVSQVIRGGVLQARAAYMAKTLGYAKDFRQRVGISKTTFYDFAKVWDKFGEEIENGDLSVRLDSGLLSITQLIEASYDDKPLETLDEAEDSNLSSRAIRARRAAPPEESEEGRKPETIKKTRACPTCHGTGEVPDEVESG